MVYQLAILALYLLIVGMAVGWLAWIVLGKSKILTVDRKPNWGALLGLGVVGSFVGGFGMSLISGSGFAIRPSGVIASFLGSLAVVAIYLALKKK